MPHILVVEDDPINARLFTSTLVKFGQFEVTVSENVDEILALVRSDQIDLVIMDVSLSNSSYEGHRVDGLEISKLIRKNHIRKHLPILIASAHAMRGDAERFLHASGADKYISKPITNPRSLVDLVQKMIADADVKV